MNVDVFVSNFLFLPFTFYDCDPTVSFDGDSIFAPIIIFPHYPSPLWRGWGQDVRDEQVRASDRDRGLRARARCDPRWTIIFDLTLFSLAHWDR